MNIDTNIFKKLTEDEQELFEILREVRNQHAPNVELRVAGGWVRDRIMNKQSDDIDIMVDKMSGADFAKLIAKHLAIQDPHVVEENPEASKHLETAGMKIPVSSGNSLDIDFACARTEVYTDDSRNPNIQPATPKEDAFRRDLTINSLFYNIHTNQVEDFTGHGLEDLQAGIIRTPLNPLKTFSDDPLRIFRTIRFASRYNWAIDKTTWDVLCDPTLREAISKKITKERIQEEMSKMFGGDNPIEAIRMLKNCGILDDLISDALKNTEYEGLMEPFEMDQNNPHHDLTVWDHTLRVIDEMLAMYPELDKEKKIIFVLSTLLHDIGKLYKNVHVQKVDQTSYHGHEDESAKISEYLLRYLKFSNEVVVGVKGLVANHMRPHSFMRGETLGTMKALRRFIRKMGEASLNWVDVFNHALADAKSKGFEVDQKTVNDYEQLRIKLQEAVSTMNLQPGKSTIAPVLNGKEVMDTLMLKPGPKIGEVLAWLVELQDENPNLTKDEARQLIRDQFGSPEQNIQNEQIETVAGSPSTGSDCSSHLFETKNEQIKSLIKDDKYFEAMTEIENLKDRFPQDDKVCHLIVKRTFDCVLNDPESLRFGVMRYICDKASKNFFDPTTCCYALGLALINKNKSQSEKDLKIVSERMINMAPDTLKKIISRIPDNRVIYKQVFDFIKKNI